MEGKEVTAPSEIAYVVEGVTDSLYNVYRKGDKDFVVASAQRVGNSVFFEYQRFWFDNDDAVIEVFKLLREATPWDKLHWTTIQSK